MLTLQYDPKMGIPIHDGDVEQYIEEIIRTVDEIDRVLCVSTENMILATRVAVKESRLRLDQVQLQYITHPTRYDTHGHVLEMDSDGRLSEWPDGFCDTHQNLVMRLL